MERSAALDALGALAQETRLDIYRLLVRTGAAGVPAGRIAQRLDLPAPTLSFHLSQLRQAALISVHRDGRSLIYAANYQMMNALLAYLTENCCQGDAADCALPACAPGAAAASTPRPQRRRRKPVRARTR